MKIELKKLSLLNFKGIRELVINFDEVTDIYGDNATGKTTIFDAFCWLLFGKDSSDKKDFNIKPLDADNNAIPQIAHEVEGVLEIDGKPVTLKRCYNEKWTRRRGDETAEFTGHETLYYYNEVPIQQNEYKAKISAIVEEGLFKLITNAMYFNSLKWEERRAILTTIAGELSDDDIAGTRQDFVDLLKAMSGKKLEDYKKELAGKKKKIKDDLSTIPARIDEIKRSIPEPVDYVKVQKDIDDKQDAVKSIELLISDKAKAHKVQLDIIQGKQKQIYELKSKLQSIDFQVRSQSKDNGNESRLHIAELNQKLAYTTRQIDNIIGDISALKQLNEKLERQIANLRESWKVENARELTFDPNDESCPVCKRPYDSELVSGKQAEMMAEFNATKVKKLADINAEGKRLSGLLNDNNVDIAGHEAKIAELTPVKFDLEQQIKSAPDVKEEPVSVESLLQSNTEYQSTKADISALQLAMAEVPELDVAELNQQKSDINHELDELKAKLAVKETIERAEKRKKELLNSEKTLSQELSELEKWEFVMDEFSRAKVNIIEGRINGKFNLVRFKMFNTLINGGIEETCLTMINGVPYPDINSAGKIQAGIDIINTLSEHHNMYAPIWIDNRETTNTIPEVHSQIINLYVTHDKSLIIK